MCTQGDGNSDDAEAPGTGSSNPPASIDRELQGFPSRIAPHKARCPHDVGILAAPLRPNTLYRQVAGIDRDPIIMPSDEAGKLRDPFGKLLASGQSFPLTLRDALAAIDKLDGQDALPDQLVFLVADGGDVPWSEATRTLQRAFRFAIARGNGEFPLLVSASTRTESDEDGAFLQIIGWDDETEVFNFYQRVGGTFIWAGMSTHALQPPSRGQGPFDSHVNGSLVMKELRAPWAHWHAPQAGINEDALAPTDPLRNDPLFKNRVTAERLETEVVRPGIRRWNRARIAALQAQPELWQPVEMMRQVVSETTVNLVTSQTASARLAPAVMVRPPLSFFINRDVLFDALDVTPDDPKAADIDIKAEHWLNCLARYDVHRADETTRIEGEGPFAFMVPEAAFEDTDLTMALLDAGRLSRRLLISLSMTDFPNPVFSERRNSLLRHVPTTVKGPDLAQAFEDAFLKSVSAAAGGGAEQEFLGWWNQKDLESAASAALTSYFAALKTAMSDPAAVDDWFRIAEFRRRRFSSRKLNEFALTIPLSNIPEDAPEVVMGINGRARAPS